MTDLINNPSAELRARKCVPCEGGVPPLTDAEVKEFMSQVSGWEVVVNQILAKAGEGRENKIKKEFKFKDFKEAMVFVNKVADVANREDHHPDISIYYSKVEIVLWTHAIGGLSENDFIIAAKIDNI